MIEGFLEFVEKRVIGIYHSISSKYLDAYVDEFEYRHNTKELTERDRFANFCLR